MLTAFVVIGALACTYAYLRIGAGVARRGLPRMWERARRRWSADSNRYSSVRFQYVTTVMLWPFATLTRHLMGMADLRLGDPEFMRRRIEQLEREAGIR